MVSKFERKQTLTKTTEVTHEEINNMEKDIHIDDGMGDKQAVVAMAPV